MICARGQKSFDIPTRTRTGPLCFGWLAEPSAHPPCVTSQRATQSNLPLSRNEEAYILEAIVAGIISAYVVSTIALAYQRAWFTPDRRRRARFFGLGSSRRALWIRCSSLNILPGGAQGTETLRIGFTGPAIIRSEYLGAQSLRSSIELATSGTGKTLNMDLLHRLTISIDASPGAFDENADYNSGPLILLGSRVYNRLTKKYFDDGDKTFFTWTRAPNGERTFARRNGVDNDIPYRERAAVGEAPETVITSQLAVIERIWDNENKRWVFLIVGVGALATSGAAKYLAENWRLLESRIRKGKIGKSFAIMLAFEKCPHDLTSDMSLSDLPTPRVIRIADANSYSEPINGIS
jgi:hypothetical protein